MTRKETAKAIAIWSGVSLGIVAALLLVLTAAAYSYDAAYRERAFRGVSIGGVSMVGLSRQEAQNILSREIEAKTKDGFAFTFEGQTFQLPRSTVAIEDIDLSRELIRYGVDEGLDRAFQTGRGSNLFGNSLTRLRLLFLPVDLKLEAALDRQAAEEQLREGFAERFVSVRDAELKVRIATSSEPLIEIAPERAGRLADFNRALDELHAQADRLDFQPIAVQRVDVKPELTADEIKQVVDDIPAWLSQAPFKLEAQGRKKVISTSTLAEWIAASSTDEGAALVLSQEKLDKTMRPLVADLLSEAKDGKLVLDGDGKVKEFRAPVAGTQIDFGETIGGIYEGWKNGSTTMALVLREIVPKIEGADAERLGIREILGVGRSNMAGSPKNRRYNIALGAKKMSGVILAPGEIFSQLKSLGPVDGAHGWLPELVIKGNKTVPEYGGGLCQIGTTSFRAALAAGLEIVERRAHSYRVRYYEPAGVDATIYDPSPDFRFKNDTANYILITSEVRGDNVITTIWGTKDGREVTQSKPVIFNVVPAPPTKYIETLELAPGQKKCTETAHAGASASFNYTVKYADGTEKKVTFNSTYRPWQAVCLIGVEALSAPQDESVDLTGTNNPQN